MWDKVVSCTSAWPMFRIPVPASMTIHWPELDRTSMDVVSPPYRSVLAPGVGNDPRQPQILPIMEVTSLSGCSVEWHARTTLGALWRELPNNTCENFTL